MNPWVLLGGVLTILGAFLAGNMHGHSAERTVWEARINGEMADALKVAIDADRKQQKEINDAIQTQADANRAIATTLDDRVQQHADRASRLPDAGRAACQGATGAELSRPDATVLERLAADADILREGLRACYAAIDAGVKNAQGIP